MLESVLCNFIGVNLCSFVSANAMSSRSKVRFSRIMSCVSLGCLRKLIHLLIPPARAITCARPFPVHNNLQQKRVHDCKTMLHLFGRIISITCSMCSDLHRMLSAKETCLQRSVTSSMVENESVSQHFSHCLWSPKDTQSHHVVLVSDRQTQSRQRQLPQPQLASSR